MYKKLNLLLISGLALTVVACSTFGGSSSGSDQRNTGAIMSDSSIQSNLSAKLNNSDNFPNSNIYVDVMAGSVLLTGQIQDHEQKMYMNNVTRGYPGVIRIYDYTEIRLPTSISTRSSDAVITTNVKAQLFGTKDMPSSNIKVETTNGVVYMMGLVTKAQAESAAQMTATVSGVQKVITLFQTVQ